MIATHRMCFTLKENVTMYKTEEISSKVTANDLVAPTACLEAINWLKWSPPVTLFCVY